MIQYFSYILTNFFNNSAFFSSKMRYLSFFNILCLSLPKVQTYKPQINSSQTTKRASSTIASSESVPECLHYNYLFSSFLFWCFDFFVISSISPTTCFCGMRSNVKASFGLIGDFYKENSLL